MGGQPWVGSGGWGWGWPERWVVKGQPEGGSDGHWAVAVVVDSQM